MKVYGQQMTNSYDMGRKFKIPFFDAQAELVRRQGGGDVQAIYRGPNLTVYGMNGTDISPALDWLSINLGQLEEQGIEGIPQRTETR
ncbi:MAG: hypothetical protein ISS48_01475 [Candidatus Aenigmarchaeota archaeon]|nr:hypothetical protein [Candidatus Aenigmarchaeota archaeon]